MNMYRVAHFALVLLVALSTAPAAASDVQFPAGGRISVELISSDAAFRNTISVVSPAGAAVAITGCKLEPAGGLGGVHVLSEKNSQHGCRLTHNSCGSNGWIAPGGADSCFWSKKSA